MKRYGIAARIRPGLDFPGAGGDTRRVFPFRRAWKAIAILTVFDVIFIIPAIFVFEQAASGWSASGELFDLVTAVFSSAWLLGWSIAPVIMTIVLLLMLFGREVVRVRHGQLEVFIGLPLIGLTGKYDLSSVRNLRICRPEEKSGHAWRGRHLAFDYGANTIELGSNATQEDLHAIQDAICKVYEGPLLYGPARPEDLEGRWEPSTIQELSTSSETLVPAVAPPRGWLSPTVLALVVANLVPIAGTIFLGWKLADVMVLYWAESAIIGFFNLIKIAIIGRWLALLMGAFFIAHFGGFMAGHFLFVWNIFVEGFEPASDTEVREVFQYFLELWPALVALFISHMVSFFRNFIGRKEYANRTINDQMMEPYGRIILMHIAIIFGGGLALILGQTTFVLLLIIAIKVVLDVRAHIREHVTKV